MKYQQTLHWILQCCGLSSMFAGFCVIFKIKADKHKPHFTTWHGFLGVVVVVWGLVQVVFGFSKSKARRWIKSTNLRRLHAVAGALFFTFACVTTALGLRSDWFQQTALVDAFDDQGLRLLIGYLLYGFTALLAIVVLKQLNDRYLTTVEHQQSTWKIYWSFFQRINVQYFKDPFSYLQFYKIQRLLTKVSRCIAIGGDSMAVVAVSLIYYFYANVKKYQLVWKFNGKRCSQPLVSRME